MRLVRLVSFAVVLVQLGCSNPTAAPQIILAHGTMERSAEGCFRIVTSDRTLQPLSLAVEFQVDGLPVRFLAVLKPTFNTCMAGETVELLHIERLN
jgi:hypothetical protein